MCGMAVSMVACDLIHLVLSLVVRPKTQLLVTLEMGRYGQVAHFCHHHDARNRSSQKQGLLCKRQDDEGLLLKARV